jgi:hypothetical protein
LSGARPVDSPRWQNGIIPPQRRSGWEGWWLPLPLLAAFFLRLPLAVLAPSPGIADPTWYFPADRPALDPVQYGEKEDPRLRLAWCDPRTGIALYRLVRGGNPDD